jgi:hypothetical protein
MSPRGTQSTVNVLNQLKFAYCVVNVCILCQVLDEYVRCSRDRKCYDNAVLIDSRGLYIAKSLREHGDGVLFRIAYSLNPVCITTLYQIYREILGNT